MKTVATLPYLKPRNGIWYYRRRVPKLVREALGQGEIVVSFETADRRVAAREWAEVHDYWETEFERLKQEARTAAIPVPVLVPLPAQSSALSNQFATAAERYLPWKEIKRLRDEQRTRLRSAPEFRPLDNAKALFLARAWFAEQSDIRLFADTPEDIAEAIIDRQDEWAILRDANDPQTLMWVQRAADLMLDRHRLLGAPGEEAYRHLTVWMRRAMIELVRRDLDRLGGDFGPAYDQTFQAQAPLMQASTEPVASVDTVSVSEAAERFWKEERERKVITDKTRQKYRAALDLAVAFLKPETPIAAVTREQCKMFLDLLRRLPPAAGAGARDWNAVIQTAQEGRAEKRMALATRVTYFSQYREFMEWAVDEDLIANLNISSLKVKRLADDDDDEDADDRRPFTVEELRNLFASPLFTGYAGPGRLLNVPGDIVPRDTARYWLPLLGLWTGARLGELCQLRVIDVKETAKGTSFIHIVEEDPRQSLKTKNAKREVPIHPELVKLGFLDFVATRRQAGEKWLFEDILSPGRANSYKASKQFGSFLVSRKLKVADICFHSFRHGFNAALKHARIPEQFAVLLMGWSTGSMGQHYGKEGSFADTVYEDVCKVQYEGLDLSSLYPAISLPTAERFPAAVEG